MLANCSDSCCRHWFLCHSPGLSELCAGIHRLSPGPFSDSVGPCAGITSVSKCMCSAGEGSLTAGMVLPGLQNGKPKYSVLTGWLRSTSRSGGSSYSSLCSPSFPLPLPISVLIIPPVKAKGEWGKKCITYILENSHSHPAWMKVEGIAGGLACACSSLTASCSLQGNVPRLSSPVSWLAFHPPEAWKMDEEER